MDSDIEEWLELGGIHEVPEGSSNSVEMDELARFAVDEHNKKQNSMVQFGRVVKVKQQIVAGILYFITLEGKDGGEEKRVYEATAWLKEWEDFKELQEFKLLADAPPSSTTA